MNSIWMHLITLTLMKELVQQQVVGILLEPLKRHLIHTNTWDFTLIMIFLVLTRKTLHQPISKQRMMLIHQSQINKHTMVIPKHREQHLPSLLTL